MNQQQFDTYLLSITGKDRVGVVSAVTGYLFETGANLADCSYAVLGEGFEFSCVAEFSAGCQTDEIEAGLHSINLLEGARITVSSFPFELLRGQGGEITHVVEVTGGDQPGLVSRLSDVLVEYNANIVRMSSRRVSIEGGFDYRTRIATNIPADRFVALEAALYNTAGSLGLACKLKKP
ncbi:MAG: hypothetical protein KUG56_03300 [Kordiimonadaceae bacterium]|nr:hypothetical protein [Kordiimonadaceae bacterium]